MAPSPRFALRVAPETLEAWKMAAGIEGLSVAQWLHRAAEDRLAAAKLPASRPVADKTPEPETPCAHKNTTKLAYMTRCDDCGHRVR